MPQAQDIETDNQAYILPDDSNHHLEGHWMLSLLYVLEPLRTPHSVTVLDLL